MVNVSMNAGKNCGVMESKARGLVMAFLLYSEYSVAVCLVSFPDTRGIMADSVSRSQRLWIVSSGVVQCRSIHN